MIPARDIDALLQSRQPLAGLGGFGRDRAEAAEGGCGVLGLAASVPVAGRHLLAPSRQMHNRGNGKGGGLAAAGLDPVQLRVSAEVLRSHYLVQIAYLDRGARADVERECIAGRFDVAQSYRVDTVDDWRSVAGLELEPPELWRYFCRVKPEVLAHFAEHNGLRQLPARAVEDELVYQNSFRLNQRYYASGGRKRAFVASHARDMWIIKLVGYAEQAVEYYRLGDTTAHVWIAHQRYPTRGRVWHPGGAHPFIGVNEALVHNGDFANYHRVTEYLRQRNIVPLFLTDTEVSVLLFDLWDRIYGYPLEVVLEALAPTTERDFEQLPAERQALYRAVQRTHLGSSPDGPWFFIVARSQPDAQRWQLLGVTDTSMLRPQVFALYEHDGGDTPVRIGLVASERQAIHACLRSLASEDRRFAPVADRYWYARGGSHIDGGAFAFDVTCERGRSELTCRSKLGTEVTIARRPAVGAEQPIPEPTPSAEGWLARALPALSAASTESFARWCAALAQGGRSNAALREAAMGGLLLVRDRRFDLGGKKRSGLVSAVDRALYDLLRAVPLLGAASPSPARRIDADTRAALRPPERDEQLLVLDAARCEPQGDKSGAQLLIDGWRLGWRRMLAFDWRGGRFAGCGLGPGTNGGRIELLGDAGDYLGSGIDGVELVVHGDAQDQVGQILQSGRLVVHGDVGQTFLYGAKGGSAFVLGSAAGRPLINAVGRPRVVINGTCLDYLAESFMAGDPLHDGGFVVLNGVVLGDDGDMVELETPYSGSTLFSLASGGAIYLRDPRHTVSDDQLNGGRFVPLSEADWAVLEPVLRDNQALFGLPVERLLTVAERRLAPAEIYRKIEPLPLTAPR